MSRSEKRQTTKPRCGRFTPEDDRAVAERLKALGCSFAAMVKHDSLGKPLPRKAAGGEILARLLTEYGKLRGELGKQGSNLNQLTHYANMDRVLENAIAAAVAEVEQGIRTLDELRLVTLQAMGRERNRKPPIS
jgi:Bacterial mobilisation protein (MobC)